MPSNSVSKPLDDGGKGPESLKSEPELVIMSGQAASPFEMVNSTFDDIACVES